MMTTRLLVAAIALLLAACNSFLGIEDVTLDDNNGEDIDAMPALEDAAVADAPVDAFLPSRIGNDSEFSGMSDVVTGFDLARLIAVPSDTTLLGFGVITKAAGGEAGEVRMGLYRDDAGGPPGSFVARSAVVSDFPTGEVVLDIAGIPIDAGSYWVAVAFNNDTPIGADGGSTDSCFAMRSFDQSMPTTGFDTATCNTASPLNLFIVVSNL